MAKQRRRTAMKRLHAAICATIMAGCAVTVLIGRQVSLPLPIVVRTIPVEKAPLFSKPDVVLMARVVQQCDTETSYDVVGIPTRRQPVFRSFLAKNGVPLSVNERAADDPDLSGYQFYFRALSNSITLTLGTTYVLLLDAVKYFPPGPEYTVSHPQIGFEVVHATGGDRVRPIVRGGELDAYDGRLLDDVIKEIQGKK
jgi:hypothetical protein